MRRLLTLTAPVHGSRPDRSGGRRRSRVPALPAVLTAGLLAAGAVLVPGLSASAAPTGTGPVDVLSAGSLKTLMADAIAPAFDVTTGYKVTDISGGSTGLAQKIKGGVDVADVFWSASPTADKAIEGTANGTWVTWYITFATSPLVLGYNPTSHFTGTLLTQPWWKVVTQTGFRIGRTNPVTDPKGRLAIAALQHVAKTKSVPALAAIATKATTVFTETSLVGRLQAGQLDAGFFYAIEASAAHFPTVPLTGSDEHASYTLTVVSKAPHPTSADAFIAYVLGAEGKKLLASYGLVELGKPVLAGKLSAVPKSLRKFVK
jgi:molybdate/tungstate transport system substrate-binding protein